MKRINIRFRTLFLALLLIIAVLLMIRPIQRLFIVEPKEWQELASVLGSGDTIIDAAVLDRTAYAIVSSSGREDYGDLFGVFLKDRRQVWRKAYTNDFTDLKPWKLEIGDVDGNDIQEILIAVRKTAHFDKEEKNRMFIFQYDGEKLVKKWTGSQTAGVWSDFIIGELLPIPGEELIFLEQSEQGKMKLSVYYWFDFGFVLLAESDDYDNITDVRIIDENQLEMTYGEEQNQKIVLTMQNGRLIAIADQEDSNYEEGMVEE